MSNKSAKHKSWVLFSEMIRLRDCLTTENSLTFGRCCTCHKVYPIGKLQGGHFVAGRCNSILFDKRNCHAQCVSCNMFRHGRPSEYAIFMLKTYGTEVMEELNRLRYTSRKFDEDELDAFSDWIRAQTKTMRETRKVPHELAYNRPALSPANT